MQRKGHVPLVIKPVTPEKAIEPVAGALLLLERGGKVSPGWLSVVEVQLDNPASDHFGAGCACCIGPEGLASLLVTLFQKRARSEVEFFHSVVVGVNPEQLMSFRGQLGKDMFVNSYYDVQSSGSDFNIESIVF